MNSAKIHSGIKTVLTVTALLVFQCCSPLTVKPPSPALDGEKIASLVSTFKAQEGAVKTLFFSGTLTLTHQGAETAVQILMIADAGPRAGVGADSQVCPDNGRIKIEITHPWGKSLLHILIRGGRLDILDFSEKRIYSGSLESRQIAERIPVPLDRCVLWSIARAFPVLLKHQGAVSFAGNQMTLLDPMGHKVQVFELYSVELLPHRVCFCKQNATLVFSDFENDDGILHARQVNFHGPDHKTGLEIAIDQMTFNKPLPEAVFGVEAPPDFTIIHLEKDSPEP